MPAVKSEDQSKFVLMANTQHAEFESLALRCRSGQFPFSQQLGRSGAVMFRERVDGVRVQRFCLRTELNASVNDVTVALSDAKVRPTWDSGLRSIMPKAAVDGTACQITRIITNPAMFGLVSGREFWDLGCAWKRDGATYSASNSIPDEMIPPNVFDQDGKGLVRGWNHVGGFAVFPSSNATQADAALSDQSCELCYVAHSETRGGLPVSVVEMAFSNFLKDVLSKLKGHLRKHGSLRE